MYAFVTVYAHVSAGARVCVYACLCNCAHAVRVCAVPGDQDVGDHRRAVRRVLGSESH